MRKCSNPHFKVQVRLTYSGGECDHVIYVLGLGLAAILFLRPEFIRSESNPFQSSFYVVTTINLLNVG